MGGRVEWVLTPLERAALTAFEALGFQPQVPAPLRSFADPQTRETWDEKRT